MKQSFGKKALVLVLAFTAVASKGSFAAAKEEVKPEKIGDSAVSTAPKSSMTGPNLFNFPTFIDIGTGRFEHISGGAVVTGYGGGYSVLGPALQAGLCAQHQLAAIDDDGNIYIQDLASNRMMAIIDGRMVILAGTGARGFRDDCPAGQAQFNIGAYTLHEACVVGSPAKGKGAVYIVDNERVRRIWKKDGKWWVDTYAGGGSKALNAGEKAAAKSIKINDYYHSVCVDHSQPETLLMLDIKPAGVVRITPDGQAEKIGTPADFCGQGLQTDAKGVLYGWRREGNFTRLELKSGKLEVLAVDNPPGAKQNYEEMKKKYGRVDTNQWDGPADKCEWYCPGTWIVDRTGTEVYASGGDDWTFRRIKNGFVKTLATDGKYHIRQALKAGGPIQLVNHGSPMGTDRNGGSIWKAGPYAGMSCIIRYIPGKDTEVEGE